MTIRANFAFLDQDIVWPIATGVMDRMPEAHGRMYGRKFQNCGIW